MARRRAARSERQWAAFGPATTKRLRPAPNPQPFPQRGLRVFLTLGVPHWIAAKNLTFSVIATGIVLSLGYTSITMTGDCDDEEKTLSRSRGSATDHHQFTDKEIAMTSNMEDDGGEIVQFPV